MAFEAAPPKGGKGMIQVRGLTVRYGERTVLDGLDMILPDGVSCLTAPSGAGKTTLLRVLAGLLKPLQGSVELLGRPILLFQEDRLFPGLSAWGQVEWVLPKPRRDEAGYFLELVELGGDRDKHPEELSGGMARRVSLARCLAAGAALNAGVYLLDEPFAGVDPERAARILERLRGLGKPILLTAHSPDLAARCDRIVEL